MILLLENHLVVAFKELILPDAKIYIAGHRGLAGSALINEFNEQGFTNIITKSSKEVDLRNQLAVDLFFEKERPEYVILNAAKVGGIRANIRYPAQFIYDNLAIELNVIHAAFKYKVKKLLFIGSACIYPQNSLQPMKEEYLLTGPLETETEFYGFAKIAGIKLCKAFNTQYNTKFISCVPSNLYGPNGNFNLENGHAIPSLIVKMHEAKIAKSDEVCIWGTGNVKREWLYNADLAKACLFLLQNYENDEIINIGTGQEISMSDLAYKIKSIVGYQGKLIFDSSKPEGMSRKLLNIDKVSTLGWIAQTSLDVGIQKTYEWYINFELNTN